MSRLIHISRQDPGTPWGFRIRGGRDFGEPFTISAVTPGGLAEQHGLYAGASILTIGFDSVASMTHVQAQQAVIRCCNELDMEIYETEPRNSSYSTPIYINTSNISSPKTQSTLSIDLHRPTRHNELQTNIVKTIQGDNNVAPAYTKIITKLENIYSKQNSPRSNENDNKSVSPVPTPLKPQQFIPTVEKKLNLDHPIIKKGILRAKGFKLSPVCHFCQQQIHGPFVDTLDHCYCPDHFKCACCYIPLNDQAFAEQDGNLYCEKDFAQYIASRCGKCHQPIIGSIIKALNKTWHPNCFTCAQCHKLLNDKFHVDEQRVLCEADWKLLHETQCAKCNQTILEIDRFVEAFGKQFHAQCFCCAACQTPLEGKPFHARDNKAFCRAHAHAVALFG